MSAAQEAIRVAKGRQVHCAWCGHHFVTVAKVPTCSKCGHRKIFDGIQLRIAWWLP